MRLNSSIISGINDQNMNHNHFICQQNRQAVQYCLDPSCNQELLFICQNYSCNCRHQHSKCSRFAKIGLTLEKIKDKIKPVKNIKEEFQVIFDQMIDEISDLRDLAIKDLEQNIKSIILNQNQLAFLQYSQGKILELKFTPYRALKLWEQLYNGPIANKNPFAEIKQTLIQLQNLVIDSSTNTLTQYKSAIQKAIYDLNYAEAHSQLVQFQKSISVKYNKMNQQFKQQNQKLNVMLQGNQLKAQNITALIKQIEATIDTYLQNHFVSLNQARNIFSRNKYNTCVKTYVGILRQISEQIQYKNFDQIENLFNSYSRYAKQIKSPKIQQQTQLVLERIQKQIYSWHDIIDEIFDNTFQSKKLPQFLLNLKMQLPIMLKHKPRVINTIQELYNQKSSIKQYEIMFIAWQLASALYLNDVQRKTYDLNWFELAYFLVKYQSSLIGQTIQMLHTFFSGLSIQQLQIKKRNKSCSSSLTKAKNKLKIVHSPSNQTIPLTTRFSKSPKSNHKPPVTKVCKQLARK